MTRWALHTVFWSLLGLGILGCDTFVTVDVTAEKAKDCADGALGGDESDIDCGGPCKGCAESFRCRVGLDCDATKGLTCQNGYCRGTDGGAISGNCTNDRLDGLESDIDCGGTTCPKCSSGARCLARGDCGLPLVCLALVCQMPASGCSDSLKNNRETDIDCGGTDCNGCGIGRRCLVEGDCSGGLLCSAGFCKGIPGCQNNAKDGLESDIDCGGTSCAACQVGKACNRASDCTSGICSSGSCQPSQSSPCTNGAKDANESDIDCGGSSGCPLCPLGRHCLVTTDCLSALCQSNACFSWPAQCSNSVKDNLETDIDCGGPCPGCADGRACLTASDCITQSCTVQICGAQAGPSCTDGIKNGIETDVDCGGSCAGCANSKICSVNSDCQSYWCHPANRLCASPSCFDGYTNGTETGVDCGGSCAGCLGDSCNKNLDCASGSCSFTTWVCILGGASCFDSILNGTETGVDCGGGTCTGCVIEIGRAHV